MSDAAMWDVPVGVDADFGVEILDHNGDPVAFTGTEPFACQLWQGDDLAPVAGVLSASWTNGDPAEGRFIASIDGSATASMASDYYLTRISITVASGRLYTVRDGWLRLGDAPGSATAPATYCSLQDMLDVCGEWLAPLMQDGGLASFLRERARARRELDRAVLSRSRPYAHAWWSETLLTATGGFEAPDSYLKGLLEDGRLVVDDGVKEATAYLAAFFVCERQLTWDGNDLHARRAAYYRARWLRRLDALNVAVDYSDAGDGSSLRSFNMGVISSR